MSSRSSGGAFLVTICSMHICYQNIIVFFSASIDSSPVSTDSSSVSTDSSLPAFLSLEPSPYNKKANSCLLFCILLLSYLLLFEMNNFSIKKISISRTNMFLRNTVDTTRRFSPSHSNATGCRLWSTGSDRCQSSVLNSMQEEPPSEIAVLNTPHDRQCCPQAMTPFWCSPVCTYCLKKLAHALSQQGVGVVVGVGVGVGMWGWGVGCGVGVGVGDGVWGGVCGCVGCVWVWGVGVGWGGGGDWVGGRGRGWGGVQWYLPPGSLGDMATRTAIALDPSLNLLLISRILVDKKWHCRYHVKIGIDHG